VTGLVCRHTRLSAELDSSGRPVPVEIKGSEFMIHAETVIVAVGQVIAADLAGEFALTAKGYIRVNDRFHTSVRGVFAGGDAIAGEGTIVQSVAHGKQAAHAIREFLGGTERAKRATHA
jgi:NADPH-dependent glutamate synthase beta subunit-like oxidoreductase